MSGSSANVYIGLACVVLRGFGLISVFGNLRIYRSLSLWGRNIQNPYSVATIVWKSSSVQWHSMETTRNRNHPLFSTGFTLEAHWASLITS